MEAATLCALMLKAKKVFAKEQTFLSFPISPLPYRSGQLDFFDQASAGALLESLHRRKEFSILVDAIATGEAWQPGGDASLSETYGSVLETAQLAISTRTAEEEAQFQAARAVLRTQDRDSDKLMAYRRCRDAYLLAEQRYTAAELTAMNAPSDDKLEWLHTTGPLLRRELAELLQTWTLDGFKEEIETAQVRLATLGARSPASTWADWRARYNPDLDALHDPLDASSVMPSGFSPSNAISDGAWRSFTLGPAEISALLQEAPADWLGTMLGEAPPQGTQSIEFEFSSAAIVRPWFDPALFKARFWKFPQAQRQLSDGKSPATGECPAYVAALVFARRVKVTAADPRTIPLPTGPFEGFRFSRAARLARSDVLKPQVTPLNDPTLEHGEIPPHLLAARRRSGMATTAHLAAVSSLASAASSASLHREPAAMALRAAAAPAASTKTPDARVLAQFERLKIDRPVNRPQLTQPLPVGTGSPAAAGAASPPPAASDDTIYVLAFICKPLAQCPDPDPALQW